MATDDLEAAAQRLLDAHATRAPFASDVHLLAQPLAFAYDVQDVFQDRRAQGQSLVGYKIGLTTPRMQKMCGLDHPIAGQILSGGIVRSPANTWASWSPPSPHPRARLVRARPTPSRSSPAPTGRSEGTRPCPPPPAGSRPPI